MHYSCQLGEHSIRLVTNLLLKKLNSEDVG
jgi:hypothetical protein